MKIETNINGINITSQRRSKKDGDLMPNLWGEGRWAKFVVYYLESGNAYRSALKAGFGKTYAKFARQMMPERVKQGLMMQLEKQGVTEGLVANRIKMLLIAKKPVYRNNNVTKEIEKVSEIDDVDAIDKGLRHVLAIRGDIKSQEDKPQQHLHLHLDLSNLPAEQRIKFAQTGELE